MGKGNKKRKKNKKKKQWMVWIYNIDFIDTSSIKHGLELVGQSLRKANSFVITLRAHLFHVIEPIRILWFVF